MEKTSGGLKLNIVTGNTFENDDIKETIISYGQNFIELEKYLKESTEAIDNLALGQEVELGRVIYNNNPEINGYVGWVNTRKGLQAPLWQPKKQYTLGQQVRPIEDNGNVYECISAGTSMANSPVFNVNKGAEFYDAIGNNWFPNYNYNVNDVVFATSGSKVFYYICETAGLTGYNEPVWSNLQTGSTLIDGSVVWRKEPPVKWKQVGITTNFRPFGKIE